MQPFHCLPFFAAITCFMGVTIVHATPPQFIEPNSETGTSRAVIVDSVPLVHTSQIQPARTTGTDASAQTNSVVEKIRSVITAAGGQADDIVKINIYVARQDVVPVVESVLASQFPGEKKPAVSFVMTRLPDENALVAMDAIAVAMPNATGSRTAEAMSLRSGSRIYIAGQAEKGGNLGEATRRTLESLQKTLKFLGRTDSDIVQLKSFLSPMANVAEAKQEMSTFFGGKPVPPTVWVEWQSPLIEIELIAWGGEKQSGPAVEFVTPPGMTASPVYSRVARTNSDRIIYLSGLHARKTTDAAGEVVDIFDQLAGTLRQSGSDLKHLVKATYYCSNNDTSAKLNELRPKYYDPNRPPAASKALVAGVGREQRGLTIDMIAVPTEKK
jgi:enamine deaminase RidA (YjgF/YER057c/UK114 family)